MKLILTTDYPGFSEIMSVLADLDGRKDLMVMSVTKLR